MTYARPLSESLATTCPSAPVVAQPCATASGSVLEALAAILGDAAVQRVPGLAAWGPPEAPAKGQESLRFDGGLYDRRRRVMVRSEGEVSLTPTEVRLLTYLIAHPGEELSLRTLLGEVWGYSDRVESRTVYTTVGRLRQKVERDPAAPRHILSVQGVGYRFEPPAPPPRAATLIGPEGELAAVRALLEAGRFVALVAPGGIGPTSEALSAVAASLGPSWVVIVCQERCQHEACRPGKADVWRESAAAAPRWTGGRRAPARAGGVVRRVVRRDARR